MSNCLSLRKEVPDYASLDAEFKKAHKKKGEDQDAEVALPITALVRYFKHQTAENKKRRAEEHRAASGGGSSTPGVKGGRVSKR